MRRAIEFLKKQKEDYSKVIRLLERADRQQEKLSINELRSGFVGAIVFLEYWSQFLKDQTSLVPVESENHEVLAFAKAVRLLWAQLEAMEFDEDSADDMLIKVRKKVNK